MAYQHHGGYSGQEYDRWVGRNSNNSTMGKVQKQFWFTKSAVLRKFGKKEDEHIVASDAELDAKINLFSAIEESTKELRSIIADYQTRICILAQEENSLGKLLKEYGKKDHTKAGKMMVAIGKSFNSIAQHRVGMRSPLVRLYQEVDTFQLRAVEDTHRTVEEMEKVRTEYRGALMWMKKISQELNPDHYQQLEKFREVQAIVKRKKGTFDQLKVKCLQKIDLLAASRCNMFSHALILYQNNLITFSEKTAKTLKNISAHFKGYEPYKFKVITELSDPLDATEEKSHSKRPPTKAEPKDGGTGNGRDQSLISLFDDQAGELQLLADTDVTAGSPSDFSNVDLLADSMTGGKSDDHHGSDSAEALLKELFDSPVRGYQPAQSTLPIFGCTDLLASDGLASEVRPDASVRSAGDSQSKRAQQFFLPSQLLDFGFCELDLPTPGLSLPKDSVPVAKAGVPVAKTGVPVATAGVPVAKAGVPVATAEAKDGGSTDGSFFAARKDVSGLPLPPPTGKEKRKLDWYKVFQEIDPLTDAGSRLFSKGYDNKQC